MSICIPCIRIKRIPTCSDQWNIGTIASSGTAIRVYVEDIATGRVINFATTSGAAGEVVVDVSENRFFHNHPYIVSVTLADSAMDDTEDITIGSETGTWVCVDMEEVLANDGSPDVFPEAVFTLL